MKDYRETLIRLDHDKGSCEVWTENRRVKTRLKRCGFKFLRAQAKGEWWMGKIKQVSLRVLSGFSHPKTAVKTHVLRQPRAFLKRGMPSSEPGV